MGNIKADRRRGHPAAGGAIGGIDVDRVFVPHRRGRWGRPCLQPRSLHAHRTFLWAASLISTFDFMDFKPDAAATKQIGVRGFNSLPAAAL
jgi:hypothetical protein